MATSSPSLVGSLPAEVAHGAAQNLREQVPHLADHVTNQCADLERRLGGAKLHALQRSITARAQALTPLYRANIMHRARTLQKTRLALVQTLQQCATSLAAGRPVNTIVKAAQASDGSDCFPNFSAVLSVARATMATERAVAMYEQPLRPTQPTFTSFLAAATAAEHDLPRRLAKLKGDQKPTSAEQRREEEEEVNALVEEALELLMDSIEAARVREGRSGLHTHAGSNINNSNIRRHHGAHTLNSDDDDDDVQEVPLVIVDEEADADDENDDEVAHDDTTPSPESTTANTTTANTTNTTTATAVTSKRVPLLVLRWPALLSLEQYTTDMPEPVDAAHARVLKRIAIEKSGKQLTPDAEVLLASTIGFYFSALASSSSGSLEGVPAPATSSSVFAQEASKSNNSNNTDDDDNANGRRGGAGTLRLSEREKLIAALTHTVLHHVDESWRGLRVVLPPNKLANDGDDDDDRANATTIDVDAVEDFIDVVRLRYVVELVAMVVAVSSAMSLITESDEGRFFELTEAREVRLCTRPSSPPPSSSTTTTTSSGTKATLLSATAWMRASVPATVLSLPGLSHLFYCFAYCLGAALTQDITHWTPDSASQSQRARQSERVVAPPPPLASRQPLMTPIVIDEEDEDEHVVQGNHARSSTAVAVEDWSDSFTATFLSSSSSSSGSDFAEWWRIWLYLWDCVLSVEPATDTKQQVDADTVSHTVHPNKAHVSRACARSWRERVLTTWKSCALRGTALLHVVGHHRDVDDVTRTLQANSDVLNVDAVMQTGRSTMTALWRDHPST